MVIGDVDAGKTTFCLMLANFLFSKKMNIGVLDLDVGQSHIGPPTMLGLGKVSSRLNNLEEIKPIATYDVGSESPAGFAEIIVNGTEFLMAEAEKRKFEVVIIDTTGYIRTDEAVNLKLDKIRTIEPDYVILLEKENELHELKKCLEDAGVSFIRLTATAETRERDLEERAKFRRRSWSRHLVYTLRRILNKRVDKN